MEPKIIIPLGVSGSGKGTQAKLLVEKLDLGYIGTGDLVRTRKKTGDFTGGKIGETIDRGKFLPTVLITKMLMDTLEELKNKEPFRGFVLDGAPRKLDEAQLVDQALEWYEWEKYSHVLLIDVREAEATLRLSNRRMCVECKKIIPYIGELKNFKKCDTCGGDLATRADDTPEGIKNRIAEYKERTVPVIDYYEKQGRLIRINGEQSIGAVHQEILKAIK